MTREPIYQAILAKFSSLAAFNTVSRRLKHWSDVPAADQPALFQVQKTESPSNTPGMPQAWTFKIDLYLYANTAGDSAIVPATFINPLLDAIVAALTPDPVSNKCTLGGLVQHAWIDGVIETDEGALGDQAVAIIPITMKVV